MRAAPPLVLTLLAVLYPDATGNGVTVDALPLDRTLEILRRHGALGWDRTLPPN